ncbi:MAG: transglycosylase SLT domain-containing protein, partial [Saprospiraceae bacterium]
MQKSTIAQEPVIDSVVVDTIRMADNPMVARLDSMLQWTYKDHFCFTTDTAVLNFCNFDAGECPEYSDDVMEQRMKFIDNMTPMDLDYNRVVQQFINMYTQRRKRTSSRMLGMSHKFFPIFEEMLDKHNLPLELKYLAIIESALNPAAKSPAGAAGLWQFMIGTGREYGLEVNSYIDERLDPHKSTEAACLYLKYLHGLYDDWNLALAAYNSGPGNVNKAIRRAGGAKNFWAIRAYLPKETNGYVPAFIAVNYVMNYAGEHNLYPIEPDFSFFDLDTIVINKELRFDQIAAFTDLTVEEIAYFNPCYTKGYIPANGSSQNLYLTVEAVGDFIANESKVYDYKKETKPTYDPKKEYAQKETTGKKGQNQITYKVRSGDVLGVIAENHNVGISDLRRWNSIRGNKIYP